MNNYEKYQFAMSCLKELDMIDDSARQLGHRIWEHQEKANNASDLNDILDEALDSLAMAISDIFLATEHAKACIGEYEACHKDDPVDVSRLNAYTIYHGRRTDNVRN